MNIETDEKNILFGVIGNSRLRLNVDQGNLIIDQGAVGNLEKLRFSAGAAFTGTRTPTEKQFTEQHSSALGEMQLKQEQAKHSSGESEGIGSSFSYDLSKQLFVTGYLSIRGDKRHENTELSSSRLLDAAEEAYVIETRQKSETRYYSGELNYQYDFTGRARILNIAYKFSADPVTGQLRSVIDGVYGDTDRPFSSDGETHTNEHTF